MLTNVTKYALLRRSIQINTFTRFSNGRDIMTGLSVWLISYSKSRTGVGPYSVTSEQVFILEVKLSKKSFDHFRSITANLPAFDIP